MSKASCSAIALAAILVVMQHSASADTIGQFTYRVPDGWAACKSPVKGFPTALCKGHAIIIFKSPAPGTDAAVMARAELDEGEEIIRDQKVVFAGQPGHMLVAKAKINNQDVLVALAVTLAGGGVEIALLVAPKEAGAAVNAWSSVIDRGTFGGDGAPAVKKHKFTIKNVATNCVATVFIDGQAISIKPGESTTIDLPEGQHEFEWSMPDGSKRRATANVPPAANLGAACAAGEVAPKPGEPKQPIPAPQPAARGEQAMFDGARDMVEFYRACWNLVLDERVFGPKPPSLDRLMLKVIAARPYERRGDLSKYTGHMQLLNKAMQSSRGNQAKATELRRIAFIALNAAGQVDVPKQCAPRGSDRAALQKAIDCSANVHARMLKDPKTSINLWIPLSIRFARIATADAPDVVVKSLTALGQ